MDRAWLGVVFQWAWHKVRASRCCTTERWQQKKNITWRERRMEENDNEKLTCEWTIFIHWSAAALLTLGWTCPKGTKKKVGGQQISFYDAICRRGSEPEISLSKYGGIRGGLKITDFFPTFALHCQHSLDKEQTCKDCRPAMTGFKIKKTTRTRQPQAWDHSSRKIQLTQTGDSNSTCEI